MTIHLIQTTNYLKEGMCKYASVIQKMYIYIAYLTYSVLWAYKAQVIVKLAKEHVIGEEWLVKKVSAYLPGAYEEVVDVVRRCISPD